MKPFKYYEISACMEDGGEVTALKHMGLTSIEELDDPDTDAVFWTVYGVDEDGIVCGFADFDTMESAFKIAQQITGNFDDEAPTDGRVTLYVSAEKVPL